MQKQWDVELDGVFHSVSVTRAENGKDVVRVDGRIAARPFGPEEEQIAIAIMRHQYLITRNGDGFKLTQQTVDVPAEAMLAALPKASSRSAFAQYGKYAWLALGVVVVLMMWYALGPSYPKQAAFRVQQMLTDIKDTRAESQVSRGLWQRNVRILDTQELATADTAFLQWRAEKGLTEPFTSFKIVGTENIKGAAVPTALVTFEIDGKRYRVIVPDHQRMQWAD